MRETAVEHHPSSRDNNTDNPTIHVKLLDEGTDVWRPVGAIPLGSGHYRIISENSSPQDERWEFTAGDIVVCEKRRLSGGECLVAVKKATQRR